MSSKSKRVRKHILSDVLEKLRHTYVDLGFKEVYNPIFIEERDIYKQWGNEAPTILDRCFYLSTLPRPDIGINQEKLDTIKKWVDIEPKKKIILQKVFHNYKKGFFDSDKLVTKIAETLSINEDKALMVLSAFPELKHKRPNVTNLTLRSHMTSGWFLTLKEFQDKESLPIKLFSVDLCFRREQALDATHLRSYHSASSVIMDRQVDQEQIKQIVGGLLKPFGITVVKYEKKKRSASYYEKNTETEVFVKMKGQKDWVEVADFGIYNNDVLKKYRIMYPVLNLGLGAERLAMVIFGFSDVRKLVYPQFYVKIELSDEEIASSVTIDKVPKTEEGKNIQHAIIEASEKFGDIPSPCEHTAYDGKILGRKVILKLVQSEKGKKLLGRAAFNEIVAYDGNILGIPKKDVLSKKELIKIARDQGIKTGIRYIDSLAAAIAYDIEEAIKSGEEGFVMKRAMTSTAGDLNIKVREDALKFITSKNKRIDLRGPVFIVAIAEIE
ncbi:MAG: O-phosphoserine--tRNA ligase [Candidatus Methylarchaceae archaeon HK02M2]|nr:O-phosphoserine--tRNA ligase [Candidatus Methylarchaceae archaeon HK02M2]